MQHAACSIYVDKPLDFHPLETCASTQDRKDQEISAKGEQWWCGHSLDFKKELFVAI
jgi:hypothetical protein